MLSEAAPPGMQEVNHPCFICGADESEPRYRPNTRHWGYDAPFVLRRCSGCGLVFNSPRLSPEGLAELYRRNYYLFARPAVVEIERIVTAYLRTVAHLRRGAPGHLLEIGSAKGYMLGLLTRLGWRVTGVEIAASAAEHSRRAFGVEVFTGTLEEFRRADERRFDVVLAQDLLEHVPEPGRFLELAHACLAPGGHLIIDTPNVGGRSVSVVGERWRGFNPFHIYLFDRVTLSQAVVNAGFTVELIGSYGDIEPEQSVLRAAPARGRSPASTRLRGAARRALDRVLLPRYLRRAVRRVREGQPVSLDPACRGENLVCIARRSP